MTRPIRNLLTTALLPSILTFLVPVQATLADPPAALSPALVATTSSSILPQQSTCQFVLGFKTLHDLIPDVVGNCVDDEQHNPANGDALQDTISGSGKGLLVWRKVDNWTAFTDGYHTWVNGPNGLQQRLNTQRFAWEANPDGLPVISDQSPSPGTSIPPVSGTIGTGNWMQVASLPAGDCCLAAAAGNDGRIYAFSAAESVAYDPNANSWTPIPPMPTPRSYPAAAEGSDGRIYVIGGVDNQLKTLDTVEAYDPKTSSWSAAAPMPTPRRALAAVAAGDGRIYTIGGVGLGGDGMLSVVEAYDPITNTWASVPPLPVLRGGVAAALGGDGHIYAFGGCCVQEGPLSTVEAFDPKTGTWMTASAMRTPRDGLAAATGRDGRVYAIGGNPGGQTVEAYDPATGIWSVIANLSVPRQGLAAAMGADGRIYAIGGMAPGISGGGSESIRNSVEVLSTASAPPSSSISVTPSPAALTPPAPPPPPTAMPAARPVPPALVAPVGGSIVGPTPLFSYQPVPGALKYEFMFSANPASPSCSGYVRSGDVMLDSSNDPFGGVGYFQSLGNPFTWQLRVQTAGGWSDWSTPATFNSNSDPNGHCVTAQGQYRYESCTNSSYFPECSRPRY